MDRRDFLRVAGLASASFVTESWPSRAYAARREAPRYVVLVLLSGGHDAVYTTDPKTKSELAPGLDFTSAESIVEKGGLRIGPHLAGIADYASRISFLNGVQVATANHDTGITQYARLKTNASPRMPSILDLIGADRDGQPVPAVYLGTSHRSLYTPSFFGGTDQIYFAGNDLLEVGDTTTPEEQRVMAKALAEHARSEKARGLSSSAKGTVRHLAEAGAWFERLSETPAFKKTRHSDDYATQALGEDLDRTAWLLEHDLTPCVFVEAAPLSWDTHVNNTPRQAHITQLFVRHFTRLLDTLRAKKNRHGPLLDNTLFLVGSDLGRFPQLNDMLGKDHLPQTSFLTIGRGVGGGRVFGATGQQMEGLPISLSTGRHPKKGGTVPVLDDIGASLLHLAGLEPERFGYNGRRLSFLFDT